MICTTDPFPASDLRTHPWGQTGYDEGRYYDFKTDPTLIPDVLEDFRAYRELPAIQRFFELLAWLNGPESTLETNDCAFRGPEPNGNAWLKGEITCGGRLQFFYRNAILNTVQENIAWLNRLFGALCQRQQPQFIGGVITVTVFPTSFLALPQQRRLGHRLSAHFASMADDETGLFQNLLTIVEGIDSALRITSATIGGKPALIQ